MRARIGTLLATRRASLVVRSVGYLLVFGGFLLVLQAQWVTGLWLVALGWLLMRAARSNRNAGRLSGLLEDRTVRDALDTSLTGVPATLTLDTLLEEDAKQRGGSGVYPVRRGSVIVGVVDVLDADRIPRADWPATRVDVLMRPVAEMETMTPDTPLLDVVARFEQTRREAFPVLDPGTPGALLGFVTRERVHRLMRSRTAQQDRDRARARAAGR